MSGLIQYILEIFRGVRGIWASMSETRPYIFGSDENHKTITELYPDRVSSRRPDDLPVRFRGALKNHIERCTGCGDCSGVCPVTCFKIQCEPGPEKDQVWVAVFDIDHSKCLYCGLCVEACPTGSLVHSREYEGSVSSPESLVYHFGKGWATDLMKQRWAEELKKKEEQIRERENNKKAPVSAELRRLFSEKRE